MYICEFDNISSSELFSDKVINISRLIIGYRSQPD